MSNLRAHAEHELKAAGFCGSEIDDAMAADVLELIDVFSKQGHSGFSAPYCIGLFEKLARFQPLTPLTGHADEWQDISEYSDGPCWQNKRRSSVFKDADGKAYDINGRVFEGADGGCYTNRHSRVPVKFPYAPKQPRLVKRRWWKFWQKFGVWL